MQISLTGVPGPRRLGLGTPSIERLRRGGAPHAQSLILRDFVGPEALRHLSPPAAGLTTSRAISYSPRFHRATGPPTSLPAYGGAYHPRAISYSPRFRSGRRPSDISPRLRRGLPDTQKSHAQVNLAWLFCVSVENKRFELLTPCLQSKCSTN